MRTNKEIDQICADRIMGYATEIQATKFWMWDPTKSYVQAFMVLNKLNPWSFTIHRNPDGSYYCSGKMTLDSKTVTDAIGRTFPEAVARMCVALMESL